MTRIKQFADALGISYDQAKKLVEEGRRKVDKGSIIMSKATAKVEGETPSGARKYIPKKGGTRFAPKVPMMEEVDPNVMLGKGKKLKRRGDDEKVIKAADGAFVRGMGRAYMGNPRATKLR